MATNQLLFPLHPASLGHYLPHLFCSCIVYKSFQPLCKWYPGPLWRIGRAGAHIREVAKPIYFCTYLELIWEQAYMVRKQYSQSPDPKYTAMLTFFFHFLSLLPISNTQQKELSRTSVFSHNPHIHKASDPPKYPQNKTMMIQLVFQRPPHCDSKVSPQHQFHVFSLVDLF